MFHVGEEFLLNHGLILFLLPFQLLLLDLFEGIRFMVTIFDHKEHVSIGPFAESVLDGEVFCSHRFLLCGTHLPRPRLVALHILDI